MDRSHPQTYWKLPRLKKINWSLCMRQSLLFQEGKNLLSEITKLVKHCVKPFSVHVGKWQSSQIAIVMAVNCVRGSSSVLNMLWHVSCLLRLTTDHFRAFSLFLMAHYFGFFFINGSFCGLLKCSVQQRDETKWFRITGHGKVSLSEVSVSPRLVI